MSTFLKYLRIDSFGAFTNRTVGPLSAGLNVVYGKNEAGKTTLASFVGGVLFGWEDARGSRNAYKPETGERAGSLFFFDEETGEERELARARNADGLKGPVELVDDIDKKTFSTMFSLDSDELRTLHNTSDVTARLLTAGSGTQESPAAALANIEARIASYTSRAASAHASLVRIDEQIADVNRRMREALEETEHYRALDREYHELEGERASLARRIRELNSQIEQRTAILSELHKIDEHREELDDQRARLDREYEEFAWGTDDGAPVPESIVALDAAGERAVNDELDQMAEEQAKAERSVDIAREDARASQAAFDALSEVDAEKDEHARRRRSRSAQAGLAIVLPIVFALLGVGLFVRGREIGSLSFTTLGAGFVVVSVAFAVVAFLVLLRPDKETDAFASRKQDAQWVMLQDRKKLESVLAAQEQLADQVRARLDELGLSAAQGSVRTARALMDEARAVRSQRRLDEQRSASLAMRSNSIQASFDDLDLSHARLVERSGLREQFSAEALQELVDRDARQRDSLIETSETVNQRFGELTQALAAAKKMHEYDDLKLEYQQLRTRRADSEADLARLLLARRFLETSIASWESRSQPKVYQQASELLALMTDGKWVRISMTPEGTINATDAVHNVRDPRHLSLGTCQQMYLALRIALLLNARNVGTCVPILADDILVNFDDERRKGAARALAQLARERQVILFTCHTEVVDALKDACTEVRILEL